jgi:hypothetical protein
MIKLAKWLKTWKNSIWWAWTVMNIFAIIALGFWLLDIKILNTNYFYEPLFITMTYISAGLFNIFKLLLDDAEYSPADALAYGYVNNYLEPIITQLIENGEIAPKIFIYLPDDLSELYKENIDRVKAQIRNKNFTLKEINLDLKHSRARDILTIESKTHSKLYFDFPNTLLSLLSYVDYKIGSKANQSIEQKKRNYGVQLINRFKHKVEELLQQKDLINQVDYVDNNLNFQFDSKTS